MLARHAVRSLTAGVLLAATLSAVVVASASAAPAATPSLPTTVTADGLPTVQIGDGTANGNGGVVWDQAVVGNTVYAVGSFASARPAGAAPGTNETPRANVLAYDLQTGVLLNSFVANTDGEVNAVAASPDGQTIYIGGNFTKVNNTTRYRIAALDPTTGALKAWAPTLDAKVNDIITSGNTVYFGGTFTSVSGQARTKVAAVSASTGAPTTLSVSVADGNVNALALSPDRSKLVIGGGFTSVNSSSNPGYGLAMVDAQTGALLPLPANTTLRDAGKNAQVTGLVSSDDAFYGTGYNYSDSSAGRFEGTFSADWNGNERWIEDCHGDSYSLALVGSVVYTASHHHYCGNGDGFPQYTPWAYNRGTASTSYATGTNRRDINGYSTHTGEATPSQLNWYPGINSGTFTGLNQGPWSVAAGGKYVVYGGEFTKINGTAQQGLVRFATPDVSVKKQGPRNGTNLPDIAAKALPSGGIRVSWPGYWDRDDTVIGYKLFRRPVGDTTTGTTLQDVSQTSQFWTTRPMGYTDKTAVVGTAYEYRLKAYDPAGNAAWTDWVSATATATGDLDGYAQKVLDTGASLYYRLDDTNGKIADTAGANDVVSGTSGYVGSGVSRGATAGVIAGNTAATFSGASTAEIVSPYDADARDNFAIGLWFKGTGTGKLAGFGSSANSTNSQTYDRQLYLDTSGKLNFGVYDGSQRVVTSSATYRDNNWHFVVGSLDGSGMKLFVDGQLVGSRSDITRARSYLGYWHVGGDATWSGNTRYTGAIDEFSVFPTGLTAQQVVALYSAAGKTAVVPAAPANGDTYGTAVAADAPDTWWRLGESSGTTAQDSSYGNLPGTINGAATLGTAGITPASTAITLGQPVKNWLGFVSTNGGTVTSQRTIQSPDVFSQEVWVKTTTTTGGRILGFSNSAGATASSSYDRMLWMLDSGKVSFGLGASKVQITSTNALNDGKWHQLVATYGSAKGALLYVDGVLDASSSALPALASYAGYWKLGGDNTWGGNTTNYLTGAVDEAAVYNSVLGADTVKAHFLAGGGTLPNIAPTAAYTKAVAGNGLVLNVDGSSSSDSDGTVASYSWDFGDGTPAVAGATASHTYAANGTYTVTLKVTDNGGATASTSQQVAVVRANRPPTASFTASPSKLLVNFDGSASADSDGTVASYSWDFGDGTAPATGVAPTHTFAQAGTYTVTLTATDNEGASASVNQSVTVVANKAPTAGFTATVNGSTASFNGSTSTDSDGTIASYAWAFGDGSTGTGASASHTYANAGSYTVTLTVTDNDGATAVFSDVVAVLGAGVVGQDSFTRAQSSGWGKAEAGGTWAPNKTSKFSVDGGSGKIALDVAGETRSATLDALSQADVVVSTKLALDTLPTASNVYVGVTARGSSDGKSQYRARLKISSDKSVTLQIHKVINGTETQLGSSFVLPSVTAAAGQVYQLRFQVRGNALSASSWIDGTATPQTWQIDTTDPAAALTAPGRVGVMALPSSAATPLPMAVAIDDFLVTTPN